mgnify:CR=1 FL=1
MGSSPGAANFLISMFNLGIAYGAKVGLKLRLVDRVIKKMLTLYACALFSLMSLLWFHFR